MPASSIAKRRAFLSDYEVQEGRQQKPTRLLLSQQAANDRAVVGGQQVRVLVLQREQPEHA